MEPSLIKGGLCERWGDRPVNEITEDDVFAVLDAARYKGIPGRNVKNHGQSSARQHDLASALSGMFRWLKGRRKVATIQWQGWSDRSHRGRAIGC